MLPRPNGIFLGFLLSQHDLERAKAKHMKIEMSLFTVTFLQSTKTMELRSCDKKMFRVPQLVEMFFVVAFYFSKLCNFIALLLFKHFWNVSYILLAVKVVQKKNKRVW